MKFAKTVFLVAGIYGLIVLVPQFFLERKIGVDTPPPITHPEFFYGFVCVAVAWQVLVLLLYLQGRVAPTIFIPASLDLVLLFLFIAAYQKTPAVDSSRS